MPESSPALINDAIRRQVLLEGVKDNEWLKFNKFLKSLERDIRVRLSKEGSTIETKGRLNTLLVDVNQIQRDFYNDYEAQLVLDLDDIALTEATLEAKSINATVAGFETVKPSAEQILSAYKNTPLSVNKNGLTLKPFLRDYTATQIKQMNSVISQGYAQGRTISQITSDLRGTKAANYKDGMFNQISRNNRIMVRTAVQNSSAQARQRVWNSNKDLVKGVEWLSTLDSRTTSQCRSLDGREFPIDKGPRPPLHYGCVLGETLITSAFGISSASKRMFKGKVITINTISGNNLTVTPNHPILTGCGWIAAKLIKVGDKCFVQSGAQGVDCGNGQNDGAFTTAKDIFESFGASGEVLTTQVPMSAPYFHGDAINNEVAEIRSNSDLSPVIDSVGIKHLGKVSFNLRNYTSRLPLFHCFGPLAPFLYSGFSSGRGFIRGFSDRLLLLNSARVHSCLLLFRAASKLNTVVFKDSLNWTWTDAKIVRDSSNSYAGGVFLDDVVSVKVSDFCGHVYNFHTSDSCYSANGIVTHNCRSTTTPVLSETFDFLDKGAKRPSKGESGTKQVNAETTYYSWLKTQPASFQDDILGPTRGKLFRNGGLDSAQFAKLELNKNYKPRTIEEMREQAPEAFKQANL